MTKNEPEEVCIVNGVERDCDELRRLQEELNKPVDTTAVGKQRRADSLARIQDSLTYLQKYADAQFLIPPKSAGEFVAIPAGSYKRADGKTLSIKPFLLSNVEMTRARYAEITGADPVSVKDAELPAPMTWFDALRACNTWSRKQGLDSVFTFTDYDGTPLHWDSIKVDFRKNGYRLTTEAEWEYAARGGTTTRFYWGDSNEDSVFHFYAWTRKHVAGAKPVAGRIPNPYGLYDIFGNATEFTLESRSSIQLVGEKDPVPYPDAGLDYHLTTLSGSAFLMKGGGYSLEVWNRLDVDYRYPVNKSYSGSDLTARIARTQVADGLVIDTYPDGRKRSQREYKDGAIVGTRTTWLDSGYVKEEYFQNGKIGERLFDGSGLLILFSQNGSLRVRTSYKVTGQDSVKHGAFVAWSAVGGSLSQTGTYTDGVLDGLLTSYWPNGKVARDESYVKGVLEGVQKGFDEAGRLDWETPFVDGKQDGIAVDWVFSQDTAVRHSETLWEKGVAYPTVTFGYNGDGSIRSKTAVREGISGSQTMKYGPDGSILTIYQYSSISGYVTLVYPDWYPSGALKTIHRLKSLVNTILYDVTFSEDGTCTSSCAVLAPEFQAADYRRPEDLEARFMKAGYVPFPSDLTGILQ